MIQLVVKGKTKDALLASKRRPFTLQKGIFYHAKGRLLECERAPITFRYTKFYYILLSQ